MKRLFFISVLLASACTLIDPDAQDNTPKIADRNLQRLARTFAELPMEYEHLQEVFDAVEASSGQGYDEEYTMECLLSEPGSGVGEHKTKNGTRAYSSYANPLRNLIREYYDSHPATKSSAEEMLEQLASSGYQVYWPYSENWDGKSFPIITFDPGYGAESNYGYAISFLND